MKQRMIVRSKKNNIIKKKSLTPLEKKIKELKRIVNHMRGHWTRTDTKAFILLILTINAVYAYKNHAEPTEKIDHRHEYNTEKKDENNKEEKKKVLELKTHEDILWKFHIPIRHKEPETTTMEPKPNIIKDERIKKFYEGIARQKFKERIERNKAPWFLYQPTPMLYNIVKDALWVWA